METNDKTMYRATAPVCARDVSANGPQVVFYQLGTKFVDNDYSIPDESKEVMYYALAVGHHTGVIDCFEEKLRSSLEVYEQAIALFDEQSAAAYKLKGIIRSSEIQIDKSHLPVLMDAVREARAKAGAASEDDVDVANDADAADTGDTSVASTNDADAADAGNADAAGDASAGDGANSAADAVYASDVLMWLAAFEKMLERLSFDSAAYIMGRMREA